MIESARRTHDVAVVLTTLPDRGSAEDLVTRLVTERSIACGNIVPGLLSIYRWEGEVTRSDEVLVLMKARGSAIGELFARVTELHPYDVPEVIALPVDAVAEPYARWVIESTEAHA
jgi:periplasmic divalent cation tolerance protein